MQVFITGATGYIGFGVAQAFRRAGHQVWGLTHSPTKAVQLARQEIHPLVGDLAQPDSYRSIAAQCDALIHCAADYQHDWAASDHKTIETMVVISQHSPQPKTVVFTSGSWVYGDTGGRAVDETAPLRPAQIGAHRPEVEQFLLSAANVRGIVVRPADVYGQQEGMAASWFEAASRGRAPVIPGTGRNHWPMVHVDDLAQGYLLAVESGLVREVFNFADRSRATLRELATAAARTAGYTGEIEYVPFLSAVETMGAEAQVEAMDLLLDFSKAARLLGWEPKHNGFIDDVNTYFEAWQAWHSLPADFDKPEAKSNTPASTDRPLRQETQSKAQVAETRVNSK